MNKAAWNTYRISHGTFYVFTELHTLQILTMLIACFCLLTEHIRLKWKNKSPFACLGPMLYALFGSIYKTNNNFSKAVEINHIFSLLLHNVNHYIRPWDSYQIMNMTFNDFHMRMIKLLSAK